MGDFRKQTRGWLEEHCPPSMRTPMSQEEIPWGGPNFTWHSPDAKGWFEVMLEKGWTAPGWPKDYGGGGLSPEEEHIFQEEMRRIGARPPLVGLGLWMLGPTLLEFANDAQKAFHLPKIVRGESRWCQGYSEPGAGSDLASLRTRAEDKGDHFLVNGQKIWTSHATLSDWMFALVRTDTTQKHGGISFLLIPTDLPGVEVRPIRLISGASIFCETFFTDAKVPKEYLIHQINKGWEVAKRVLVFERQTMALNRDTRMHKETPLCELAKTYVGEVNGQIACPVVRDAVARQDMDDEALKLAARRGAHPSTLKLLAADINKARHELTLDVMGQRALGGEDSTFTPEEQLVTQNWLRSRGNSIESGTSEIQLNIIARRTLGMR